MLDVGAGTGLVGAELARLGLENLTALDLSQQMLRRAMGPLSDSGLSRRIRKASRGRFVAPRVRDRGPRGL
ncbi:MAG: class I SAM-dependent methyltransferase [Vulcanimicrobiota bacterium]